MDELWMIPAIMIIFVITIFGSVAYSIYEENQTTRLAIINRCENAQTDGDKKPVWTNCKGPIQQPITN